MWVICVQQKIASQDVSNMIYIKLTLFASKSYESLLYLYAKKTI
jgi:hypothetical protein